MYVNWLAWVAGEHEAAAQGVAAAPVMAAAAVTPAPPLAGGTPVKYEAGECGVVAVRLMSCV